MKHGIISCGFIAEKHVEGIKKLGGEVYGSYDIIPDRVKYGIHYRSAEQLIADCDVIHICAPTVFHVPYLEMCYGKKVIVEKPIAVSTQQSGLIGNQDVAVCFQRRFNKQCQEIKKACDLEKPQKIIANIFVARDYEYWESWRGEKDFSGGGALMNVGIHYLDLMQWWTGEQGEVQEAEVSHFRHSVDMSASAKIMFGETEARMELSATYHRRSIEMIVIWKDKIMIYDTDDATHFDVFDNYLNKGIYISPQEAVKSLKLVEDIYNF